MDEFALCWNSFQDNIATGFQNLYDRGDLVDVTLACDGKLLQAHKVVLAICSPYFQEIFISNPCKHPIIILNDVSFTTMSELLQFMYQGVVNVKHTDLTAFMKIGQALQIKGLTTPGLRSSSSASPPKGGPSSLVPAAAGPDSGYHHPNPAPKINSAMFAVAAAAVAAAGAKTPTAPSDLSSASNAGGCGQKRTSMDLGACNLDVSFGKKSLMHHSQMRRGSDAGASGFLSDHDMHDSIENLSTDESSYMRAIPQISMDGNASNSAPSGRFDLNAIKHESMDAAMFRAGLAPLNLDYSVGLFGNSATHSGATPNAAPDKTGNVEYPNELHISGPVAGGMASGVNHMDIPAVAPGEKWTSGKLVFMLSQRGKPLLVHDGHSFGIQYIRKDKKYWQCNLSRKYNCKARVTTTETGEIIVTNNEHCHTEIRQHLRKEYKHQQQQQQLAAAAAAAAAATSKSGGDPSPDHRTASDPSGENYILERSGGGCFSPTVPQHLQHPSLIDVPSALSPSLLDEKNATLRSFEMASRQQQFLAAAAVAAASAAGTVGPQPPIAHQNSALWTYKHDMHLNDEHNGQQT